MKTVALVLALSAFATVPVIAADPANIDWSKVPNDDDKSLKEGGVHNVGFAIHDDNITTRGHHVSFVKTLGFGAKADIQAVKLP
jgi:hypothetical protein